MCALNCAISHPVKIPMTPKGVEHRSPVNCSRRSMAVKIPMTPKGVEHLSVNQVEPLADGVKIPMTPKGVEHALSPVAAHSAIASEDSNDAERR